MYLDAISFIAEVKTGAPFAEHSPMLAELAGKPSWAKLHEALCRLYRAEVLGKLPVAQHFSFGTHFPATWAPSRQPVPSDSAALLLRGEAGQGPEQGSAASASSSSEQQGGQRGL